MSNNEACNIYIVLRYCNYLEYPTYIQNRPLLVSLLGNNPITDKVPLSFID